MYRRRPEESASESFRELRRLKRRRSERMLLYLLVLGPIMLLVVLELGRAMFYMQRVKSFALTLDQQSPAEVKAELKRFALDLTDRNPLVRDGAMASFKIATGWNLGTDGTEWRRMWNEQSPYWEYRGSQPVTLKPPSTNWTAFLPPALLQSSPPPATAQPPAAP